VISRILEERVPWNLVPRCRKKSDPSKTDVQHLQLRGGRGIASPQRPSYVERKGTGSERRGGGKKRYCLNKSLIVARGKPLLAVPKAIKRGGKIGKKKPAQGGDE